MLTLLLFIIHLVIGNMTNITVSCSCMVTTSSTCSKSYLCDGFAHLPGDLLEDRAVHDIIVGPRCSRATQWRVGTKLDPFLAAERPQLRLTAVRMHLHLLFQFNQACAKQGDSFFFYRDTKLHIIAPKIQMTTKQTERTQIMNKENYSKFASN